MMAASEISSRLAADSISARTSGATWTVNRSNLAMLQFAAAGRPPQRTVKWGKERRGRRHVFILQMRP
jgi:hypothetical protein